MNTFTSPHTHTFTDTNEIRFSHLMRAEWIKVTSLRLNIFALLAVVGVGFSLSLLFAFTLESAGLPSVFQVNLVLDGLTIGTLIFGQVIAGVLGVLTISSEYSSGTIQPTMLAAPNRLQVLAAKAAVLFSVVTGTALFTVFGSWATTYPLYAEFGLQAPLTTPGLAVALLGCSVYIGLCSIFGLGIGALLRSATAGSIAVFCVTLLAPILTSVLPTSEVVRQIRLYLMGHAGDSMSRIAEIGAPFADASDGFLSPLGGWVTAAAWAILTLIAGAIILQRRDV